MLMSMGLALTQGWWKEAEVLEVQVKETCLKVFEA